MHNLRLVHSEIGAEGPGDEIGFGQMHVFPALVACERRAWEEI